MICIYTFICNNCNYSEDKRLHHRDRNIEYECPICGGIMIREISAPNLIFKGTGFYETDYKRKKK